MILTLVLATITVVGVAGIALAEPRRPYPVAWSDDLERRLLRDGGKTRTGWW
jgi:hypothetical protein